jgi:hypothetical protein
MLSVVWLNVVRLNVIMLSVVAPFIVNPVVNNELNFFGNIGHGYVKSCKYYKHFF